MSTDRLVSRAKGWHRALLGDRKRQAWLRKHRGIGLQTIKDCGIGWDARTKRYTVPIATDDGVLHNVRRYSAADHDVISVKGFGSPVRLFSPFEVSDADDVLLAEGEMDCLATAQAARSAGLALDVMSGTGGAGNIPPAEELETLRDRNVCVVYDCDDPGIKGAAKFARALQGIARSVRVVDLGLGPGEDLTDWLVTHGRSIKELYKLARSAPLWTDDKAAERRPTADLLQLAVETKVQLLGSRNAGGFWLACQLRDEGYTRAEAEPVVLEDFRLAVTDQKPDPYTVAEARDSLASAYSTPPRAAVGQVGAGYGLDDVGNSERLLDQHGRDVRYVAALGGWQVWDGRRWALDSDLVMMRRWAVEKARKMKTEALALHREGDVEGASALRAHARASANASRIDAMIRLAQAGRDRDHNDIAVAASAFDRDPALLPVANGTVVLGDDGATFREHRRLDYCTRALALRYRPEAEAPIWDRFLAEALPDPELRRYLQRLVGYSLYGENPGRLLVFLLGPTSTGKSTFGEVLVDALGEIAGTFNLSMFRVKQDEGPRPDLADALAKRFLFMSEASGDWHLHGDVIKQLTGNDTVKVRRLYSNAYLERRPAFTPWIATNNPPQINGADKALWQRLVAVPWQQRRRPDQRDETLRSRIVAKEAEGVLAWAVAGWDAYRRDGLADVPAVVATTTMRLRESLSPVDRWLAECCVVEPEAEDRFDRLWPCFRDWTIESLTERQARDWSKEKFRTALDQREFPSKRKRDGSRRDDTKTAFRRGLRLAPGLDRVWSGP